MSAGGKAATFGGSGRPPDRLCSRRQTVEPNTVVAEVIDPARLVVTASVPAREAIALKAGQRAELVPPGV
ncbi:MAG TPA: HlyD family efflux transporter periplasmic adaptor subunit, partial [Candidatus Paceibacterota bacterium]|nr:HlyD family efflux transporter periplasmic adaptor subunit [Candidatus Paceibacterota bacterium]